jgi:hypothetical protein
VATINGDFFSFYTLQFLQDDFFLSADTREKFQES